MLFPVAKTVARVRATNAVCFRRAFSRRLGSRSPEHGSAGTTIRAVARAAGVDPRAGLPLLRLQRGLLDAATAPPSRWLEKVAETWSTPRDQLAANCCEP